MGGQVQAAALGPSGPGPSGPGSGGAFVRTRDGPLNILVANAGIMALPARTPTPAGWGRWRATDHLGHFAPATGLRPALRASARPG